MYVRIAHPDHQLWPIETINYQDTLLARK